VFIGRVIGWLLLGLASLAASGDAVMLLGTGDWHGLAARELVLLLAGTTPAAGGAHTLAGEMVAGLLAAPAWVPLLSAGVVLAWSCRPRRRRIFARSG